MKQITIREALRTDLPRISEIENSCFVQGVAYSLDKLTEEYKMSSDRWYVVEDETHVIGYLWSELWVVESDMSLPELLATSKHNPDGDMLYIANIAVAPEARGYSIGKMMTNFMLADLPKVRNVILAVSEVNKYAIAIYRKLGFHMVTRIEEYYEPTNGPKEAAYVMMRLGEKK